MLLELRFKIKKKKNKKPTTILQLLPEFTEGHRTVRVTRYSSVCKGQGSGCIAPDYRIRQDRLPGVGSLKDVQEKERRKRSSIPPKQLKSCI